MSQTQFAPNLHMSLQKLIRICLVAITAGGVLALLGPFGTFESMTLIERILFWGGGVAIGAFIHVPLFYGAAALGRSLGVPVWLWVMGSAVVAAMPMTFVINGVAASLFNGGGVMESVWTLYPQVLLISVPMQWVAYFTADFSAREAPKAQTVDDVPETPPETPPPLNPAVALPLATHATKAPPFLARLPARLGKDLICLEMEDHYVRVHTRMGDTMIHLRMSDAVTELEGVEGMLVHRSSWVARDAITGWSREGKTLLLQLSNGKSVPVARDRQPLVRAAGWLE